MVKLNEMEALEQREAKRSSVVKDMLQGSDQNEPKENSAEEKKEIRKEKRKKVTQTESFEIKNAVETRSERTPLLLTPTLKKESFEKCEKMGISFNEAVCQLLEIWIKQK